MWIVYVMLLPVICGMSHKSSWLETYGHVNLENPHELSRSP
jgi:hypothetical protein